MPRDVLNTERAMFAQKAIDKHQEMIGSDEDTALCDLLTDLRHWCDLNEVDFHDNLNASDDHYCAEKLAERKKINTTKKLRSKCQSKLIKCD